MILVEFVYISLLHLSPVYDAHHLRVHICMYVCIYVCMNVSTYECMYVCCSHGIGIRPCIHSFLTTVHLFIKVGRSLISIPNSNILMP
jgi:hypothetical protein